MYRVNNPVRLKVSVSSKAAMLGLLKGEQLPIPINPSNG
jgi:hypothetical protein